MLSLAKAETDATIWLIAGIMAILLTGGIAALAGPIDACTRTRIEAPLRWPHRIEGETRHAADVTIDRVLMFKNCEEVW